MRRLTGPYAVGVMTLQLALATILWAGAALVVGLVAGVLAGSWWHRQTDPGQFVELSRPKPVELDPQLLEVLGVLRSAAMIIGPHDQVLHATPQSRSMQLCRGDRINQPKLLDEVRSVRRDQSATAFDFELGRGIGAPTLHLNVRIAPLANETVLLLADDRTPMLRIDETRRDFVANVSHELKTPIGAISLLSEAVEGAADDPDAVRHFASRMHRESQRLSELVTQIIDLSRLQSDDPMLKAADIAVGDIIDEALQRSSELAAKRKVNLVRTGDESAEVLGDQTQLVDAVANLIQNAIVYSDEKARVAITTTCAGDEGERFVEISVADNGIGISATDQQRVFERFYRVDYGRSRANGGTGLGLSIVKHIAAVHGGSVNLWSQLGQGSTFTLSLPVHDNKNTRTSAQERQS